MKHMSMLLDEPYGRMPREILSLTGQQPFTEYFRFRGGSPEIPAMGLGKTGDHPSQISSLSSQARNKVCNRFSYGPRS